MSEHKRPWQPLRRETIYTSPWVNLHRDDVRLPDGSIIEGHHVLDFPFQVVVVVPVAPDGRILMIEHYRFITDTTGWELPAGGTDFDGEEIAAAAQRELVEETGHRATSLEPLGIFYPANGISNETVHAFVGRDLYHVSDERDTNEVQRMAWFTHDEVRALVRANAITDGISLTALLWYLMDRVSQ